MANYSYEKYDTDDHVAKYRENASKIVENSKNILKKASVPVPIVKTTEKKDLNEPVKGFDLEHVEEDSAQKSDKKTDESRDMPETVGEDITDMDSSVNQTYSDILELENKMNKIKSDFSAPRDVGLQSVSEFVDNMEDIEDAGQNHIDDLSAKYPEGGNINGTAYLSYDQNDDEKTVSAYANVSNTWQNKNKTLVVKANGIFGYERTQSAAESTNPFENYFDDEDEDTETLEAKSVMEQIPEQIPEQASDELDIPSSSYSKTTKFGKIALGVRKDTPKMTYGIGATSNFYSDGNQVHDQHISAKYKALGIAGDLMRRTVVSKDEDTGETITRSQMKVKLDLINRNKETEDDNYIAETENAEVNADEGEQNNETVKTRRNGTGLDVDFKYDDTVCGFGAEYGFSLSKKENTKFIVAPVVGLYDYTNPNGDEAESLKGTIGVISEFEQKWKDGKKLDLRFYGAVNRVVQSGSHPSDSSFALLEGNYRSAKGNFSVNGQAGIVQVSDINMKFAEVNVNQKIKNGNIGVGASYSKVNAFDGDIEDFQVTAKYTYNIPYKTKK